jgi:MFS transporter, DHA3 family, macrolide efflux protein
MGIPFVSGFRGFLLLWFGQFVSLVGSALTRFAITIWAYQQTESVLALTLVGVFSFAPGVIFGPIAGVLVDRWERKKVMILSDLGAGISTIVLFALYLAGDLQIWHLYIAGAFSSIFDSFQFPAFSATITMMVPKQHFARANGLQSLADNTSTIAAPVLAGGILAAAGLQAILLIDIVTFLFAISTITAVFIPRSPSANREKSQLSLKADVLFGFRYIRQRPSLLGMQMMFFFANLFGGAALVLIAPMVLARTNGDELALGTVQAALGIGGVAGSLLMGVWGGSKRRVHNILISMALSGMLGHIIIGLSRGVAVWSVGAFLLMFFIPLMNAANQAIWQSKVAPNIQGRVFTVRRLIAQITLPISMFTAGWLADFVFEPAMQPGGTLAPILGQILGTGPGTGMSVIFLITGVAATISGLSGYLIPAVRTIETALPDHHSLKNETPAPVVDEHAAAA